MKDYLVLLIVALGLMLMLQRGCKGTFQRMRDNRADLQEQRQEKREHRQQAIEDWRDQKQKRRRRFMDGRRRFSRG